LDKILVRDLTKTFPTRYGVVAALEHLDLAVGEGEFFVLLGPSGYVRVESADNVYNDHQVAVVLYSPAMRREKVDQARRFMEAYLRSLYDKMIMPWLLSALEKLGRYK